MEKDKKNHVVYTLRICFNPETDEVEYIAEGIDDDFNFTPLSPYDLSPDVTQFFTWEDMDILKKIHDITED